MKLTTFTRSLALAVMILTATACTKKPSACFSMNKNGTISLTDEIKFNASCSENGSSYLWDYGDGTTGDGPEVSHRFDAPGSYSIQLTVCYKGQSSIQSQNVVVSK